MSCGCGLGRKWRRRLGKRRRGRWRECVWLVGRRLDVHWLVVTSARLLRHLPGPNLRLLLLLLLPRKVTILRSETLLHPTRGCILVRLPCGSVATIEGAAKTGWHAKVRVGWWASDRSRTHGYVGDGRDIAGHTGPDRSEWPL